MTLCSARDGAGAAVTPAFSGARRCVEGSGLHWAGWLGLAWAAPPDFHHPFQLETQAASPGLQPTAARPSSEVQLPALRGAWPRPW